MLFSISSQDFPLYLSLLLSGVALVTVLLAVGGNKYAKVSAGITALAFVIGIGFLIGEGMGYFGALSVVGSTTSILTTDWVSLLFGIAVLTASLLVGLVGLDYMKGSPNLSAFYALLIFTSIGALLLTFATDLLMIFIAWELMSIPSYVLTGFRKKDPASNEASVKYFVISAFSSAVLLYGISLLYLLTGSTNINTVLTATANQPVSLLALTFIIAGFGIKLAAVPFHMWIPDAYQGAPTIISSLLSAGTKGATFAPVARILFVVFAMHVFQVDWSLTLAVLAVLSMTLGNFAALTSRSVTRILAYSSIGQAGYILVGFAAGGTPGLTGSFFHILNYAVMQSGAFLAAALIIRQLGSDDLSAFDGVGKRMSVAPLALTLSLLALGGFPPLNGFWSKLTIFYAAINANLGWLAIIAIINSFASIAFYVRIVKHMYVDNPRSDTKLVETNGFRLALILVSVIIVAVGIYPYPFIQFASTTATSFMHEIQMLP